MNSNQSGVTDDFEVTLTHQCAANVLTLNTPTPNLPSFTIPADPTATATHNFAGHTAGGTFTAIDTTCVFTIQLQIYDDVANVWNNYSTESYITSYTAATGAFVLSVPSTDGPNYSPATAEATVKTLRYVIGD